MDSKALMDKDQANEITNLKKYIELRDPYLYALEQEKGLGNKIYNEADQIKTL